MDDNKKNLKGSPSRDEFKWRHKKLRRNLYGSDLDYSLVEFQPEGIAGFIDFKKDHDCISTTEVILYNTISFIAPVFIVQGDDLENGRFDIYRYYLTDIKSEKPLAEKITSVENWHEYEQWEILIRQAYKKQDDDWKNFCNPNLDK